MRSLTLLRHAKTERDSPTGRDQDRQLTERGRRDAERLGAEIQALGLGYDGVFASPARRSVETVECVASLSPTYDERIYNASIADLLEVVRSAPADVRRLMLVGHNPGFEQLAALLAPGSIADMPTCTLAEIELPIDDWRELEPGAGRIVRFIDPKELD
jgi:phosphohistidine phosphatase